MHIYKRTLRILKKIGKNIDEMPDKKLEIWDKLITKIIFKNRLKEVCKYLVNYDRRRIITITDNLDNILYKVYEVHSNQHIYHMICNSAGKIINIKRIAKPIGHRCI